MSRGDKSKQVTAHAIDACNQDEIIDIFEESFGYLSFVQKFVTRIKQEPIPLNDKIAQSTRPLVVLDIDNTILFVRFFADEICVDDDIKYVHNGIDEISGIVTAVWYQLKLELNDDDLIDEFGTDIIEYDHCHIDTNRIKKKTLFMFPYKINNDTNQVIDERKSLIKECKVIGCEIQYSYDNEVINKFISFENDDDNDNGSGSGSDDMSDMNNFIPCLNRKGYTAAAFVHNGFIVRIRHGAEEFLETLEEDWDIVFFTAANKAVYESLMIELESYLYELMGRDYDNDGALWHKIYFRNDCTFDYDERGKIYHHKDLTKYNKDLSKVVIVDNSYLSYKSLEPNAILIKDFYGKKKYDTELEVVTEILDNLIDIQNSNIKVNKYTDFRYILCGIMNDDMPDDLGIYDRKNPDDILQSTQRFLNDLKEHLMDKGLLPKSLQFGEPKNYISSDDDSISSDGDADADDDDVYHTDDDDDGLDDDNKLSFIGLDNSITSGIQIDDYLATPKGNDVTDDDIDNDNDKKQDDNKDDNVSYLALPQNKDVVKRRKRHKHTHSYSISLKLKDIPNLENTIIDANEKKAIDMMMDAKLNEADVRGLADYDNDDDDSESDNSGGIGSREEDDTDDDIDDNNDNNDDDDDNVSDWDDISDDQKDDKKYDIDTKIDNKKDDKQDDDNKDDMPNIITDINDQKDDIQTPVPVQPTQSFKPKPIKSKPKKQKKSKPSIDPALINLTHKRKRTLQNKRFTMAPRPDQDKINEGMSSVFLKRSVNRLQQMHEHAQRLARASSISKPKPLPKKRGFQFDKLKGLFEQEIDAQSKAKRKSSLRGKEAKKELQRYKRMIDQSNVDKHKVYTLDIGKPAVAPNKPVKPPPAPSQLITSQSVASSLLNQNQNQNQQQQKHKQQKRNQNQQNQINIRKPKKLITRVDNPWIAKLKKEGRRRDIARLMRKQQPKSIPRRMTVDHQPYAGPLTPVDKRKLPPSPVQTRKLPQLPGKNLNQKYNYKNNNNKSNSYSLNSSLSVSYTPPIKSKSVDIKMVDVNNNNNTLHTVDDNGDVNMDPNDDDGHSGDDGDDDDYDSDDVMSKDNQTGIVNNDK